jgi:hypothetical protein
VDPVSVSSLKNASEFRFQCPIAGLCTQFYLLEVDAPAEEYLLNVTVEGSTVLTAVIAGGSFSCPTAWSSNSDLHATETVKSNARKRIGSTIVTIYLNSFFSGAFQL